MSFREKFFGEFIISEKLKIFLMWFPFRMLSKKIILNYTLPYLGKEKKVLWTKGQNLEETNSITFYK